MKVQEVLVIQRGEDWTDERMSAPNIPLSSIRIESLSLYIVTTPFINAYSVCPRGTTVAFTFSFIREINSM